MTPEGCYLLATWAVSGSSYFDIGELNQIAPCLGFEAVCVNVCPLFLKWSYILSLLHPLEKFAQLFITTFTEVCAAIYYALYRSLCRYILHLLPLQKFVLLYITTVTEVCAAVYCNIDRSLCYILHPLQKFVLLYITTFTEVCAAVCCNLYRSLCYYILNLYRSLCYIYYTRYRSYLYTS